MHKFTVRNIFKIILSMECLLLKNKQNNNKINSHTETKDHKMSYLQSLKNKGTK